MLQFMVTRLEKMQFFIRSYCIIHELLWIVVAGNRIVFTVENDNWCFEFVHVQFEEINGLKDGFTHVKTQEWNH